MKFEDFLIDKKAVRRGLKKQGFTKIEGKGGFTEAQKKKFMKMPGYKKLVDAYKRSQKGQRGSGKMEDFWKKAYKGIMKTGKDVDKWLKDTKAISKGAAVVEAAIPVVSFLTGQAELLPGVAVAEGVKLKAQQAGYGKKVRGLKSGRPMRGNGTGGLNGSSVYGAVSEAGAGRIKGGARSTAYGMISSGGNRMKF